MRIQQLLLLAVSFGLTHTVGADPMEISCTIRSNGANLNCQIIGKDRKSMDPEDVAKFIDAAEAKAFITLKGRKGMERTFEVDGRANQFKRLRDIKNSAPMSEKASAKTALFAEIEKKVIKLSDELDGQSAAAELVLWDPSITLEKAKRETRTAMAELEGYRKNREKICTNTPAFEQVSKANQRLQQTLSNIIYAFHTPSTCMVDYKIYKDAEGAVDLRQLDTVSDYYKAQCKK